MTSGGPLGGIGVCRWEDPGSGPGGLRGAPPTPALAVYHGVCPLQAVSPGLLCIWLLTGARRAEGVQEEWGCTRGAWSAAPTPLVWAASRVPDPPFPWGTSPPQGPPWGQLHPGRGLC